jgi:hypothetical protein
MPVNLAGVAVNSLLLHRLQPAHNCATLKGGSGCSRALQSKQHRHSHVAPGSVILLAIVVRHAVDATELPSSIVEALYLRRRTPSQCVSWPVCFTAILRHHLHRRCMIIGRHHRGHPNWLGETLRCMLVVELSSARHTRFFVCTYACLQARHMCRVTGSWLHSCQHSTCQSSANPARLLSSKVSSHPLKAELYLFGFRQTQIVGWALAFYAWHT